MPKTSLLIRGTVFTFKPELALAIGLEQAVVLQQLTYLLDAGSGKEIDGHKWLFNTYEEWQEKYFPFISLMTLKRIIRELEGKALLVSCQPEGGISRKKYYRLGEGGLAHLNLEEMKEAVEGLSQSPLGMDQPEPMGGSARSVLVIQNRTTENTTKNSPLPPAGGSAAREKLRSLPDSFNRADFREAWEKWCIYWADLKKRTIPNATADSHLDTCIKLGPNLAIEALNNSISKGFSEPAAAFTRPSEGKAFKGKKASWA